MKYLIVFYGGGHVPMCLPIIAELQKRGHDVVPLALTIAGKTLKDLGIHHKRVIDYVDFEKVAPYGKRLLAKHHTDGKGISQEESLAYLGVSLQNLAQEMGEEKAWEMYQQQGLNAFCAVEFMKDVLRREKPDVVVATNSPRMEKAALRAAHALGIPSLCMIDLFALIEMDWLKRADNGMLQTVYSDKIKQRLIKAGRAAESIHVTGNPAFDRLAQYKHHDAGMYRSAKNIPAAKKIILWAEQPEPEDPELPRRVRAHLSNICQAHADWQLVIRLHPGTDATKETMPPNAIQSFAQEPLYEAMSAADVVITMTSTVGMEALLMGKPLLIIALSHYQHFVDYTEEDGALVVDALEKTERGLETLLTDNADSRRLAAIRAGLPQAGDATSNICNLLEHIRV